MKSVRQSRDNSVLSLYDITIRERKESENTVHHMDLNSFIFFLNDILKYVHIQNFID